LTETELIEECRGGNLTNFRTLVELTSPLAYSLAFRMLGDEDLAKDVVQESMVTVWQKLKNIRSAEVYRTWIYRIVVNKCNDHFRYKKRNREMAADEKTWRILAERISQPPSSGLENDETARIIGMLTEKLSPKQKTVFILSEIEAMTSDEISEVTGISKPVIKANLYHARKSIAAMIEKYL
jgi:RNA polymerase sigma-70 factor (ECF subfamily)